MNKFPGPAIDSDLLQALIFDVDGTLADTERDLHRTAFNRAFMQAGLDWYWDVHTYGTLLKVAGGKERILHYMGSGAPIPSHCGSRDDLIRELHGLKTRIYLELIASGQISLRPGVERLLREARRSGFRLAIATTTTEANVIALLESTLGKGSQRWFDVIGAGDVVSHKKPAPDIYDYVLEELKLPAGACFAFEDSANGLRASIGAGLRTIVTPALYTAAEDFTGAFTVVEDLGEPDRKCRYLAGHRPARGIIDAAQLDAWQSLRMEEFTS